MVVENLEFHVQRTGDAAATGISNVSKSLKEYQKQSAKATSFTSQLVSSLARIAFYRVIRGIIKGISEAMKEGSENAYYFSKAINGDLAKALDELATKNYTLTNQFGAAWASLLQTLQPILLQIIAVITRVMDALTQLFSALGGRGTYLKAVDYSKEWAKQTKSGAKAAKEWKNQLLGFDEINKLEAPSDSGYGGGAEIPDYSKMFEEVPLEGWAQKIADNLALIETVASGFALALGLILTLTGANPVLGIGLIALGVMGLAQSANMDWSTVPNNVATTLHNILVAVGLATLAVGAVLAFSGVNIPLGLALMAVGFSSLVTAKAIRNGVIDKDLKQELTKITTYASIFLFAVGAILTMTGVAAPLGLAMMAAGIVGYGSATVNWSFMADKVKEAWQAVKDYYNEHIKEKLTLSYWQNKLNEVFGRIEFPHIKMPHIVITYEEIGSNNLLSFFFGVTKVPHLGVEFYAKGGFPEDGLFFANHGELVGQFENGRTAVANNEQIIEGIQRGVYDAVVSAMSVSGNGDEKPIDLHVYLDSREIRAGQERLARATGGA